MRWICRMSLKLEDNPRDTRWTVFSRFKKKKERETRSQSKEGKKPDTTAVGDGTNWPNILQPPATQRSHGT